MKYKIEGLCKCLIAHKKGSQLLEFYSVGYYIVPNWRPYCSFKFFIRSIWFSWWDVSEPLDQL